MESRWCMRENLRAGALLVCMTLLSLVVQGCQSTGPAPKQQWSHRPIESFGSVAGTWAGLMVRSPKAREDDWVRVYCSLPPSVGMEFIKDKKPDSLRSPYELSVLAPG
jgi:hypothetical protein